MSVQVRDKINAKRIPTGWCMEGQHTECAEFYLKLDFNRGCVCDCHTDKETPDEQLAA